MRPILWLVAASFLIVSLAGAFPAGAAKFDEEAIQRDYREVLALVAEGDRETALERLAAFETDTLGTTPKVGQVEQFWRYKLRVISELMDVGSLDLLVPIIVLHHDAYPLYVGTRRSILAAHSRKMAMELADLYAQLAGTQQASYLAARILVSLAGHHQKGLNLQGANTLFAHSLALDARNEAASVGLAVNYEKRGQYRDAIPHLERALDINPANHETRLRLALCTRRIDEYGMDEVARDMLRRMLRQEDELPRWVLSLVYQELGNLEIQMERHEEAEATLRRGLERFPRDQHLQMRLALLLKRTGRRDEAAEILARVEPRETYDSPRRRYNSPPMDLIEVHRRSLEAEAESRLPLLAASLVAPPVAQEAPAS